MVRKSMFFTTFTKRDEGKITFIIPSLNRPTLPNSINSLLNQTDPNWECIIIYDGVDGPDFDDKRIKTIKIEKTGIIGQHTGESGLVRNYGIKEVKTSWIGFLDDDDTIHPNYVRDLFTKYSEYDFVIWRMKYSNGRILPPLGNNDLVFGNVGISFCYRNIFGDVLFENNRNGEDLDMIYKIKSLTNNYVLAREVYYNVRH